MTHPIEANINPPEYASAAAIDTYYINKIIIIMKELKNKNTFLGPACSIQGPRHTVVTPKVTAIIERIWATSTQKLK